MNQLSLLAHLPQDLRPSRPEMGSAREQFVENAAQAVDIRRGRERLALSSLLRGQ